MATLSRGSKASLVFFLLCAAMAVGVTLWPTGEAARDIAGDHLILEVQAKPIGGNLGGVGERLAAGVHTLALPVVLKDGELRVQHGLAPFPAPGAPRLEEVIAVAEEASGGTLRYTIETKIDPLQPAASDPPAAYAARIGAAVEAAGIADRVMLQSFDWRSLEAFKQAYPDIPRVHLTVERDWLDTIQRGAAGPSPWLAGRDIDDTEGVIPDLVAAADGAVWAPHYKDLSDADLRAAHALGLKVVVWTVNEPAHMADLIDRGVDGILTDAPRILNGVLEDRGLPRPAVYAVGD